MKKKFCLLALIVLLVPVLALVGCDKPSSFTVEVFSSWTGTPVGSGGGTVSGGGTFEEGTEISLTATSKPNSRFIAWIHEDSVIISNEGAYSISNETTEGRVTKSTLTFEVSSSRRGKYTAVFDDPSIVYTKLTSFRITNDYLTPGVEEAMSTETETMTLRMYISQGNANADIYSANAMPVKRNVIYHTNDVNEVLKLNADTAQNVVADVMLTKENSTFTKTLRASVSFQENVDNLLNIENPHLINYNTQNGTYEIIFSFTIGEEQMYLVLTYSNLNVIY